MMSLHCSRAVVRAVTRKEWTVTHNVTVALKIIIGEAVEPPKRIAKRFEV